MQIFVRNLEGESCLLQVDPNDAIELVKRRIAAGVSPNRWRLIYGGKHLEDNCTLSDYDVQSYSTLESSLRLLGGAKKRKKKTYTTPKKIRHRKKKVKLAVLKYYKIDENGKVSRLRKECTSESCGAGVFMANHFNRQYCGKCYATLVVQDPKEREGKFKEKGK